MPIASLLAMVSRGLGLGLALNDATLPTPLPATPFGGSSSASTMFSL